jgi:protein ImuA
MSAPHVIRGPVRLAALRRLIQAVVPPVRHGVLPFGDPRVDGCLGGGGLALGVLHEVAAEGLEAETGTAGAAFIACLLARIGPARPVFWIARRCDLHAPGLVPYGLDPGRLVLAQARDDVAVVAAMEAALRAGTAAAVVGEAGQLPRLAARRLQLAALARGSTGFLLRRWPYGAKPADDVAAEAVTRWQVAPAPTEIVDGEPGLPRWRVALRHARGGSVRAWLMEPGGTDAAYPFRVVAGLADHPAAPACRHIG